MQSSFYNRLYASFISALALKVSNNISAVLDLLLSNNLYDFESAVWLLTFQYLLGNCTVLQTSSKTGWRNYTITCVRTPAIDK